MRKTYELLEHTADIAIRVKANDLKGLFKNAALAMFDIMAGPIRGENPAGLKKFSVRQEADNLEELFINWLNELLYLSTVKEKIFCEFIFKNLDEHKLDAVASGGDISDYKVNAEIKAATYHELEIKKTGSSWQVKVIFDV